jgi:hypothetical protein
VIAADFADIALRLGESSADGSGVLVSRALEGARWDESAVGIIATVHMAGRRPVAF